MISEIKNHFKCSFYVITNIATNELNNKHKNPQNCKTISKSQNLFKNFHAQ